MIGRLNHVAVVVPDLDAAVRTYRDGLGAAVSAPCYLVGDDRLVLPAFSTDAKGVNVLGHAGWRHTRCCAPAGEEVLDFGLVEALARRHRSGRR